MYTIPPASTARPNSVPEKRAVVPSPSIDPVFVGEPAMVDTW